MSKNNSNHVFVYEFVTGGGWHEVSHEPPPVSFLQEGRAMVLAIVEDLQLAGHPVTVLRDARLDEFPLRNVRQLTVSNADDERKHIWELAQATDWTLLIAPEFNRILLERVELVERVGGRLLSPNSKFVAIASDKLRTNERLRSCGVSTPLAQVIDNGVLPLDFRYPAVVKPRDGAGSMGVRRVESSEIRSGDRDLIGEIVIEQFCSGAPASVSVISGLAESIILPASLQLLSAEGRFQYLGGEIPIRAALDMRARRLAAQVISAMPPTVGYFGIDVVLGETEDTDVVIEVNPRLTTSYVGLRRFVRENLAGLMVRLAKGVSWDRTIRFGDGCRFSADGVVRNAQ